MSNKTLVNTIFDFHEKSSPILKRDGVINDSEIDVTGLKQERKFITKKDIAYEKKDISYKTDIYIINQSNSNIVFKRLKKIITYVKYKILKKGLVISNEEYLRYHILKDMSISYTLSNHFKKKKNDQ